MNFGSDGSGAAAAAEASQVTTPETSEALDLANALVRVMHARLKGEPSSLPGVRTHRADAANICFDLTVWEVDVIQLQALNEAVLHKYEKFSEPVHHILSFIPAASRRARQVSRSRSLLDIKALRLQIDPSSSLNKSQIESREREEKGKNDQCQESFEVVFHVVE